MLHKSDILTVRAIIMKRHNSSIVILILLTTVLVTGIFTACIPKEELERQVHQMDQTLKLIIWENQTTCVATYLIKNRMMVAQ